MRSGLVIGTFVPPHAGHHFLIDTARAQVDALTVVVCETADQPIPAELRAGWLREAHPDVAVVVVADAVPAHDLAGWAASTRSLLGRAPDVIFTSETASAGYARELGCDHVSVDPGREALPMSASEIRADPLRHLDWVTPAVRAYLIRRVCVIGPESTGKTTLCERLAQRFRAPWVAEYGREYTLCKLGTSTPNLWRPSEFVHIAREQQRRENDAARHAPGLLVCDTDAFATEIWLERYCGKVPIGGWPPRDRPIDLYLLTDPAVPFVADAIRDGEHLRTWMYERFVTECDTRGFRFVVLSGDYDAREQRAMHEIETLTAASFELRTRRDRAGESKGDSNGIVNR